MYHSSLHNKTETINKEHKNINKKDVLVFNVTLKKIIVSKPKGPTILVELSEFSIFQGKVIQQLPRTHHISRKTILYLSSRSRILTSFIDGGNRSTRRLKLTNPLS